MEISLPMDSETSDCFSDWLSHVTKIYLKLSDVEKNKVLNTLISVSGPNQLVSLTETLPNLLYRDFVSHLPSELLVAILKYLDAQDLQSCCQVSLCWRERIECLVDLWSFKARELGVIVPATQSSKWAFSENSTDLIQSTSKSNISNDEEDASSELKQMQSKGKLYKKLYFQTKKLFTGLKSGKSLSIRPDFIRTGNRRINSMMFHGKHLLIGTDNQVQLRSIPDGKLISSFPTHSVCDMVVKHSTIYTASFNANLESWDLHTGVGKHIFCGHTSAVLSVDVSEDGCFVLTGSVDRTAKLWEQRESKVDLMITLDDVHHDWVFKVKFISVGSGYISFVTFDSTCVHVWRFDIHTHQATSKGFHADKGKEFISVSYRQNSPSNLYTSVWSESQSMSEFCTFEVKENGVELKEQWYICKKIKAYILAVGLRFMLVMCSISSKDFFLLDIQRKSSLLKIATPDCLLTRNKSTVAVCDTSWLDGFDYEHLLPGLPFFAACVDRHSVMLGLWNTQLMDHPKED